MPMLPLPNSATALPIASGTLPTIHDKVLPLFIQTETQLALM
jgi:hypothetical protein